LFERLRTADTRLAELESVTKEQPSPGAASAAAEVAEEIGSPDKFSVEIIPQSARAKQVLGCLDRVVASRFPYRIGRIEEERGAEVLNANELSLRDEKPYNVSRSHCALAVSGGICYFQDRGSRVGSVVAGERIGGGEDNAARKALKIGDNEICLGTRRGELIFNFRVSGPEAGILQRLSGRLFG
jgi:pSer/pThr/pTyr-binding forkhead associated (FHA) protein